MKKICPLIQRTYRQYKYNKYNNNMKKNFSKILLWLDCENKQLTRLYLDKIAFEEGRVSRFFMLIFQYNNYQVNYKEKDTMGVYGKERITMKYFFSNLGGKN